MTEHITSADWEDKVMNATKPVLVDFFATWCGPCKAVAPVVDEVALEVAGKADVYKIDVDQNPDISSRYGVMSIPTFIVFKNGQPTNKQLGAIPKDQLLALLA